MKRALRIRAIRKATGAWRAGRPHDGIEIMRAAGYGRTEVDEWIRACHREARRGFARIMTQRYV